MKSNNLTMDNILNLLPQELVERHNLEDIDEELAREKAQKLLEKRANIGLVPKVRYHTSNFEYKNGEMIRPYSEGKVYFSDSIEGAYIGDHPKNCYKILVNADEFPDPKEPNKKRKSWYYTRTPVKVIRKVENWRDIIPSV